MERFRRWQGPMGLACWAVILNLISDAISAWLANRDFTPDWLASELTIWLALLLIFTVAYLALGGHWPTLPAVTAANSQSVPMEPLDDEQREELAKCRQHVDALKKVRDEAWEELAAVKQESRELAPTVQWAKKLIDQESTLPHFEFPIIRDCHISHVSHLTDPQPYMRVNMEVPYHGNMRLLVGHEVKGKFGFAGVKFADAPEVDERPVPSHTFPFEGEGRASVWIVFHQKLPGRQDEIKGYLDTHEKIVLDTTGMMLSVRVENPIDGNAMYRRNLFGNELTARVSHGS